MSNHEKQFVTKVGAVYRTCVFASDYEELQAELARARELLADVRDNHQHAIHWEDLHPVMARVREWLERNQ